MTWLAARFPKARILSISYDAKWALKSLSSGSMDLYPLGESLVQEMVFSGVGVGQKGCPVVFVCHYLGGLIAKHIIVVAHKRSKGNIRIEKLLRNTEAFVFYATPHGGSESVKMNSEIGRLNGAFEAIQRIVYNNRWKFPVIAETHATSQRWRLSSSENVPEASARHIGYDDVIHVAADHYDVCKHKSESDSSFLQLVGCILEVVADYESRQAKMLEVPSLIVGVDEVLAKLRKIMMTKPVVGLVGMGVWEKPP